MMPIKTVNIQLTADLEVKQKAAVKQMQDLLTELEKWIKYRLLTSQDRRDLIAKGFARDLVDNVVYLTQRNGKDVSKIDDHLVTGFTDDAFDPSIYSCEAISQGLKQANEGRCSWCESLIEANSGIISHYRPPYGYSENNISHRNSYYQLVYDPQNLFYTCTECAEKYKADQFPIIGGQRAPQVPVQEEQPVLINPYTDEPRQCIRFNPLNGHAYPYDQVLKFYQEIKGKAPNEIEQLLWGEPANIPLQHDVDGTSISLSSIDIAFNDWLHQQTGSSAEILSRGKSTIDILGLNRPSLVRSRNAHLRQLRSLYLAQFCQKDEFSNETVNIADLVKSMGVTATDNGLSIPQYLSMTLDAINTWLIQDKYIQVTELATVSAPADISVKTNSDNLSSGIITDTPTSHDVEGVAQDTTDNAKTSRLKPLSKLNWFKLYNQTLTMPVQDHQLYIPSFIRSSLIYIVLENELELKNKRRIVSLNNNDLLYGSTTGKCVFLPLDWHQDYNNVIKVHESNHTWETSFAELSKTRPQALLSLFANSEVWAEGNYQALG